MFSWDSNDTQTSSEEKPVRQVTEKGHPVREVAERLGKSNYSLYEWIKKYGPANGAQASRLANKDDEIRRLRAELKRVTEERNILKRHLSRKLCPSTES